MLCTHFSTNWPKTHPDGTRILQHPTLATSDNLWAGLFGLAEGLAVGGATDRWVTFLDGIAGGGALLKIGNWSPFHLFLNKVVTSDDGGAEN